MPATVIPNGAAVLAVAAVAWASRDALCRWAWMILAAEWALVYFAVGDDRFWAMNPAAVGACAAAACVLTRLPGTRFTIALFTLYGATLSLHFWAAASGRTLDRLYFEAANALFSLRLLLVGAWGGWSAVRHRATVVDRGSDRLLPRRATLARHRAF